MNNQSNDLHALTVKQLEGTEVFSCDGGALTYTMVDVRRWAYSNLAANNLRGHLAEFLVALDLKVGHGVRISGAIATFARALAPAVSRSKSSRRPICKHGAKPSAQSFLLQK